MIRFALFLCVFLCLGACTKKRVSPKQIKIMKLSEKLGEMEVDLGSFKSRIKAVYFDHGLRNQLVEDQELLRSRIERLRLHRDNLRGFKEKTQSAPQNQH